MVIASYSSLPSTDGWEQIDVALRGVNPLSPAWLWTQHNEHRMVIPKLFVAADLLLVSSHTEILAYQHSGNAIPAFDGAGLEHAGAGGLARHGVAHRRRHCGLLPFLAHPVGEPDNRLFDLLHSAGILCHGVVRRADAVLEAFPATTWQMAYVAISPAVGSRCIWRRPTRCRTEISCGPCW